MFTTPSPNEPQRTSPHMNTAGIVGIVLDFALFDTRFIASARRVSKTWTRGVQQFVRGRMKDILLRISAGRDLGAFDMDAFVMCLYAFGKWRYPPGEMPYLNVTDTNGRLKQLQSHPFPSSMTLCITSSTYVTDMPQQLSLLKFTLREIFPACRATSHMHSCDISQNGQSALSDNARSRSKDGCFQCVMFSRRCRVCKKRTPWDDESVEQRDSVLLESGRICRFLAPYGYDFRGKRSWMHCSVCAKWVCAGCTSLQFGNRHDQWRGVCIQCTPSVPMHCYSCDTSLTQLVEQEDLQVMIFNIEPLYIDAGVAGNVVLCCATCVGCRCLKCNPRKIFVRKRLDSRKGSGKGPYTIKLCNCRRSQTPGFPLGLMGSGLAPISVTDLHKAETDERPAKKPRKHK